MKDVTLFTTQTCPHCKTAKAFLKQNHIQFVEKDVNYDAEAQKEMSRRGIRGVPAFIIGDDAVIGLDQAKVLKLVDHRVVSCPNCQAKLRVPNDKGKITVRCPKCKTSFETK